ncbi:MAG: wax ester/triacylglycerol synthase family O-acyltransferase, partial [Bacteroidota bacterium]
EEVLNGFIKKNMEPISGLDATFLYAETPTTPMHIGGIAIIEGSLKFEDFKEVIRKRLHQAPRLRKRLVFVPFSIDHPYWVDDPRFDLDMHLHHVALPKPGGWSELRAMASKIHSEALDRSRPLWSFTFVEGIDNIAQVPKGSVAIISKIHHVAIDGMAGVGLMSIMFDLTPTPKEMPEPEPFNPAPIPNELSLVVNSTANFAKNPLKFPKMLGNVIGNTLKTGVLSRIQHTDLPTAPFSAPRTILNGPISARRKWNLVILELDRVKALKQKMETTFNDIILAICSGAMRRYLLGKKKLPQKSLVASVPVSIRTQDDAGDTGNRISNMLIQLATNIPDPIERLKAIHDNTVKGKTYNNALGAETLSNMAEAVPFGLANRAARIYSRFNLSKIHKPVYNAMITNVPGTPMPLYINGHKMVSMAGLAPILDRMGVIITVFSYNGQVTISTTSDAKTMPDIDKFSRYIREAANELEEAVLAYEKKQAELETPPVPENAESDIVFERLKGHLKEHADKIKPGKGVFQFNVTGDVPTHWRVDLNKSPGTVRKIKAKNPDVTLTISDEHLMKLGRGKLNFQMAFIQGRLKVDGDSEKAMSLAKILSKVPKLES